VRIDRIMRGSGREVDASTAVRVAVSDPLPIFRRGVMAALGDAGFETEAPDDVLAWAGRAERRVVLLTVRGAADWELLAELGTGHADVVVVAVLDDVSVAGYVRAIAAGAAGAIPRDATPAVVRTAFQAALDGTTVLPTEVVRALAARQPPAHERDGEPSAREIGWLRDLARGVGVSHLAEGAGYSERMMFRLLRELYDRLGVGGRTEALMLARDRGWI
jgi:DNA-binding NarL/FixJ family response regulator